MIEKPFTPQNLCLITSGVVSTKQDCFRDFLSRKVIKGDYHQNNNVHDCKN